MRIPSGKTDQALYFVAYDSADHTTRKTGLSSFTVYRSRNGGAATAYTTPTVAELSSSNMPGLYALTIDEDTTIASTSDSEEYAVHITASGMDPVSRTVELYRRDVTTGKQLLVDGNGRVDVAAVAGTAQTARDLGANLDTTVSSRLATTGYTAPLDAAGTRSAVGLASANLDTQLATIAGYVDTEVGAIKAKTDQLTFTVANQVDVNVVDWKGAAAPAMTGDAFARLGAPAGSSIAADIAAVQTDTTAIKAKTDNLPADPADASDIAGSFTSIATTLGTIQAKTANLPSDPADASDIAASFTSLSSQIGGLPSSAAIASAVWDESLSGHATAGTAGKAVSDIEAKTGNLPASPAATGDAMTLTGAYDAAKAAASQTSLDAARAVADAIKLSTDNLPSDPADQSLVIAATTAIYDRIGAPAGASVSDDVAAVRAKTDQLSFSTAGEVDANIHSVNDVTVTGLGTSGSPWGPA